MCRDTGPAGRERAPHARLLPALSPHGRHQLLWQVLPVQFGVRHLALQFLESDSGLGIGRSVRAAAAAERADEAGHDAGHVAGREG